MGPIALSLDVSAALPAEVTGGKTISIAVWLFYPDDPALLGNRAVTMALLSGGSYDKRYHHAVIPGHPGYSAAEHLAARGNIVILLDHLGMGESTRVPDQKTATRQIVAIANHAALQQIYGRLAAGDLHPALPALPDFVRIGGGHSMGAMQTVIQQAGNRTYDAIMVMGYTAKGVHFTLGGRKVCANDYLPTGETADYTVNDRKAQRGNFHWGDVPEDVMLADDALAVETPANIGIASARIDIIKAEAAAIDVPVFFGQGEQDVSPDPRAEPGLFPRCDDFTLFILPQAAHCQSFASGRHLFWDRMHAWCRGVALTRSKEETGNG